MKLQSTTVFLQNPLPLTHFSPPRFRSAFTPQVPTFQFKLKSFAPCSFGNLNSQNKSGFRIFARRGSDPFRGKSGSVSFGGLTHQSVEENQLMSAPFKAGTGSLVWVLAPVALISSLILPQIFVVNAIEDVFKNEVFAEMLCSCSTELIFYAGLALFLFITQQVQKPYLHFSPKRWGLITGLKGYLTSAFFVMGFKVFAPIIAVYVTWPVLGYPALVSIAPFLSGCLAQYVFEKFVDGSSCWPVIPIIFDVYRIYQLTRATNFMERLIYAMRDASVSPPVLDRTGALVSMIVTFRVLGVACLWSLLTFLLRLFPSRPVAENY